MQTQFNVHVSVDPPCVRPGHGLTLTVQTSAPGEVDVTMPDPGGSLTNLVALLHYDEVSHDLNGYATYVRKVRLEPSGEAPYGIGPMRVEFTDHGINPPTHSEAWTSGVALRARPPLPPLQSPLHSRVQLVSGTGATLVAVLLAVALVRRVRMRREARKRSPATVALRELDALRARRTSGELSDHELCIHLSRTVREYLRDRYAVKAPEQTTEELAQSIAIAAKLTDSEQKQLLGLMRNVDLVKFAEHDPAADEAQQALTSAYDLVRGQEGTAT